MENSVQISLEAARVNANMTQAEASKALGVSERTLWAWEHGYCHITTDMADRISELYKIPLGSIRLH